MIDTLCDTGSVLELRRGWGEGMVTALARVGGRALGVLANNPAHLGGAIDVDAADKASRFLQLCDAFDLPAVFDCHPRPFPRDRRQGLAVYLHQRRGPAAAPA